MTRAINISLDELVKILPGGKVRGKEINCNCPFCTKEGHFYVEAVPPHRFQCKKCNEVGNLFKLLRVLNKDIDFVKKDVNIHNLTLLKEPSAPVLDVIPSEVKNLPTKFIRLTRPTEYLIRRRVSANNLVQYRVGTADTLKYRNYIIFSVDEQGECRGFVGRCILPKEEMEALKLKRYRNSEDTKFNNLLFGYDKITSLTKVVILVEGIFDAITIQNLFQGSEEIVVCATFGKVVSDSQINKLLYKNIKHIVLFHDFDALKEIKKNSLKLKSYFSKVEISVLLNGKDANDSTEEEIIEVILKRVTPEQFYHSKVSFIKK